MESKINILFLNLDKNIPLVDELTQYYDSSNDFEVWNINNITEATQILKSEGNGILIIRVSTKEHLSSSVEILKTFKALNKKGLFRCLTFLDKDNAKIRKLLNKYGCSDVLEMSSKPKTVSFKIDFWTRGMKTVLFRQANQEKAKKAKKDGGSDTKMKSNTGSDDFKFVDPISLPSDMWILKTQKDCKRIIRRYLIKMMGPSTHVGSWQELESRPGDKAATWKWEFNSDIRDQFILDDGSWVFYGPKPEFDWKAQVWNFSGEEPHLYFYRDDDQVFSRVKFKDKQVFIAANSEYCLAKKNIIVETADSKFEFESDKAEEELKKNIENDDDDILNPNLKGKSKTDNLDDDPLRGNVNDRDEDMDPLRGKVKDQDVINDDPLSGRNSNHERDFSPLGGKRKNKDDEPDFGDDPLRSGLKEKKKKNLAGALESSEDDVGGFYGADSKTDKLRNDPLGAKFKPEEDDDGPLSGKSNTDRLNRKPLGAKINPEDVDNGPLSGKSDTDHLRHDPLGGKVKPVREELDPLSGKADTDQLRRDPLGAKVKPEREELDPLSGKAATDQLRHDPLSGKSDTDQLNRDPLGAKVKPDAKESGPLSGKSDTDQLNRDPLGAKVKPDAKESGPLSGKSETDQLNRGPLGAKVKPDREESGPLSGKADTDQLKRDPLKGAVKPNQANAGSEEDEESSSDELSRDPLSRKKEKNDRGDITPLERQKAAKQSAKENEDGELDEDSHNPSSLNKNKVNKPSSQVRPGEDDIEELERDPIARAAKKAQAENNPNSPRGVDEDGELSRDGLNPFSKEKSLKAKNEGQVNNDEDNEQVDKNGQPLRQSKSAKKSNNPSSKNNTNSIEEDGELSRDGLSVLGASKKNDPNSKNPNQKSDEKAFDLDKKHGTVPAAKVKPEPGTVNASEKNNAAKDKNPLGVKPRQTTVDPLFDRGSKSSNDNMDSMLEILGGGLTDGLNEKNSNNDSSDEDDSFEPKSIDNINLESGLVKVQFLQKTSDGLELNILCQFEDLFENELVILAPIGTVESEAEAEVKLTLVYSGSTVKIESKVMITSTGEYDETRECVYLTLLEVDDAKIAQFMELYEQRQGAINDFMLSAKGF